MISVAAAKKIIADNILILPSINLPLQDTLQMRLSEDVYSAVDVPAFPQSSMDGYAFAYADWQSKKKLLIDGEMQAGSKMAFSLQAGQAVRIFTGAPLPAGADTIIMQEKVSLTDKELIIHDESLEKGNSVRSKGSAIKKGELALSKKSLLSPGAIGFLAGMGISEVSVFVRPVVSIIVTGKELQQPGMPLAYGEVYESNSFALKAVLQQLQINDIKLYSAGDDLEEVKQVLIKALADSDMVLLTGGVSVGDYDFVVQAAEACGVTKLFHKIKQRPGKPLYFGKKESKLIFGLPGNPSSVLTCFYEYVLPALGNDLMVLNVSLGKSFHKPAGLTQFLKGWYDGKTVMPLDAQESYRMSSFAIANCLIKVDEETTICKEGELSEIHLLPF
ncbi:MAG: molybdopterin molybdotransferase MoeA [Chitinophagaceae bacterium]